MTETPLLELAKNDPAGLRSRLCVLRAEVAHAGGSSPLRKSAGNDSQAVGKDFQCPEKESEPVKG